MSNANETQTDKKPANSSKVLVGFLLAAFCGAALMVFFVHQATSGVAGKLAALISGRQTKMITAPAVVERIQGLNRLESVVYSLDTIVEGNETFPLIPDALAGDRLLLIVHGQTIAGVDLSKLKPEEVRITGNSDGRGIQITLPPSEVFLTTIDNAHTRVYERSTGLLVHADPNLESLTRQKAQVQLQDAALSDGILDAARKNAIATLTTLLHGLGFSRVDVH